MATYYAVGNGTNWSSSSSWASTSGGTPGAGVPGVADTVLFDGNSPGNIMLDASVTNQCLTLDCTGFIYSLILASAQTFTIAGNKLKLVSGMTLTLSGTVGTFLFTDSVNETVALTSGGLTMPNLTFGSGLSSSSSTYQLQDGLTIASTQTLTHTCGTLDFNSMTCSIGLFNSNNSNARTIKLGSSAITVTGGNGAAWNVSTGTNLVVSANTSTISWRGSGSTTSFYLGGSNWNGLSISLSNGSLVIINGGGTLANLTLINQSGDTTTDFAISNNITITGTLTVTGNKASQRIRVYSAAGNVFGTMTTTQVTLTTTAVSLTYADWQYVKGAGAAAPFTGTSLGDCTGNSSITFDSATTQTWSGNTTGNWSTAANWTSRIPLPQDTVSINALTSGTITADMYRLGKSVDFTGSTGGTLHFQTFSFAPGIYGDLTLVSGLSLSGGSTGGQLTFYGSGSHTLTTAGKTFPVGISITSLGGTYVISGDLILSSTMTLSLTLGTLDAATNSVNVTCGLFGSSNASPRTLHMGSGSWTLSGTGTIWSTATNTNLVLDNSTASITATNTSSSTKTFSFGTGNSIAPITIPNNSTGAYIFNAAGTMTLNGFTFGTGTTHTFQGSRTFKFATVPILSGSSGNVITINSGTSGTAAVFSYTAGGVINGTYLSIQDNKPTQVGVWFAGHNSTLVSNTGNWIAGTGTATSLTAAATFSTAEPKLTDILLTAGAKIHMWIYIFLTDRIRSPERATVH